MLPCERSDYPIENYCSVLPAWLVQRMLMANFQQKAAMSGQDVASL